MAISALKEQVIEYFQHQEAENQNLVSPMPGFMLLRSQKPSQHEATVYDPSICLILQGRKETSIGDKIINFGAGESLIVSHSVPVVARITEASPALPYLAVIMTIDTGMLRTLSHEIEINRPEGTPGTSLNAHETETRLIDALTRYLALSGHPMEANVMGPLIQKEIHFRLLMAPHGIMLRQLIEHGSYASQISRSISQIKKHFKEPLSVSLLARDIGMSESLFYRQFKQVTETTPLQYQKDIRLIEAQVLLRNGEKSVSSIAFDVGYASPTQFSREYSRKFGISPREEHRKQVPGTE